MLEDLPVQVIHCLLFILLFYYFIYLFICLKYAAEAWIRGPLKLSKVHKIYTMQKSTEDKINSNNAFEQMHYEVAVHKVHKSWSRESQKAYT